MLLSEVGPYAQLHICKVGPSSAFGLIVYNGIANCDTCTCPGMRDKEHSRAISAGNEEHPREDWT